MQKKLVALAVVAALSTPAFAESSFYGILDAGMANVTASGQKGDLLVISGGASQSRIGFKADESLNNGMKAVVVMEYGLDTDISTGLTTAKARQNMLALAGGFGTVAGGYLQTTVYDFNAKYDPFWGSKADVLSSVTKGGGFLQKNAERAQHAVAYISPKMGALSFAANYSTALQDTLGNVGQANNATAGLKTTAYLLSGSFDDGPVSAGLVYGNASNSSTTGAGAGAKTTEMILGGSYDLGAAKVMATYASSKVSANAVPSVTNTAMSVSAVVPMPSGAVAVSYAKNTMKAVNSNGSGFALGYLHNLSKDTTAYFAYESVSNGSAVNTYSVANNALGGAAVGTLTNGGSSSMLAVGLRKKF